MAVSGAPVLGADEDLPAAPRQARSRATRSRLLEAGRNLFAERGYHATSIEDITSRAGTAAGAFYTYFRSKRQLLLVLMNELLQLLAGLDLRPKGGADVRAGLRRFLTAVFRADLEYYGVVGPNADRHRILDPSAHPAGLSRPAATSERATGSGLARFRPDDGPAFLVDIGARLPPASPGFQPRDPDFRRRDLPLPV